MTAELMSMSQGAKALGITRSGMRRAVERGAIAAFRLGVYWYVSRVDVEEYARRRLIRRREREKARGLRLVAQRSPAADPRDER